MTPSRQEIEAAIEESIRKALNREIPPITPETSMTADLGVDSLDLVEIVYGVEETYDVEIAAEELFPQRLLRDPANVENGAITATGIEKLRQQFSWTSLPNIEPGTSVDEITRQLSTVGTFTDYVQHVIERSNSQ